MKRIKITPDWDSALLFAVETRRGNLLRTAELPKSLNVESTREVLIKLIDVLGEREQTIRALQSDLDDLKVLVKKSAGVIKEILNEFSIAKWIWE